MTRWNPMALCDDIGNEVANDLWAGSPYETSRDEVVATPTNLLRDVAFNRKSMNDGHHISPYDNGKIQVGGDGIIVKLTQGINEDAFKRTLSSATRATIGLDLTVPGAGEWEQCNDPESRAVLTYPTKIGNWSCDHVAHRGASDARGREIVEGQVGYGADWEEMLKGGLQTALETQVIVFEVQGVSRTCTHQLVRTRNAAFHQQSQRASFYGNQPEARMPESVWLNVRAREAWMLAKQTSDYAYRIACEEDISYQDARYALLEGTNNYIMCEYSIREFMNVFAYRGCSMFSWEIVTVMREMRRLLVEAHPWLAPYIKISCEKTGEECVQCRGTGWLDYSDGTPLTPEEAASGNYEARACYSCDGKGGTKKCTFQGWEEVTQQCDFPWAREDNRTFVSTAHGIKKRPGMNAISEGATPGMKDATPRRAQCWPALSRPEEHGIHEHYVKGIRYQCGGYLKEDSK